MLLRLFRGRVLPGREDDFVALTRRQVAEDGRAPGLVAFMAGYRRVDRSDRFVLVSTWESEVDMVRAVGERPIDRPRSVDILAGIAQMERVDQFDVRPPAYIGILDAPGAVVRVTEAVIKPGRQDDLFAWLKQKDREINASKMVLGWTIGTRVDGDVERVIAVTAWPSPLMIEALADDAREGRTLFAAVDEFITDARVEQYQAIELRVPERIQHAGGRRLIAARFPSGADAEKARSILSTRFVTAREAGVSVARLANAGRGAHQQVLVARVTHGEYLPAERLIADLGGQVIYEADETHR